MRFREGVGLGLVTSGLCACTVGDRYFVPADTWQRITALSPNERAHTVAPVTRVKRAMRADVLTSAFSEREAEPQHDGRFVVPTRMKSRKLVLGSALVWIGTPLSFAGLAMVIWGSGAVRYAGMGLAGGAEPLMIAGTVLWVQAANSHPQEIVNRSDLSYLPVSGAPGGMPR